MVARVEKSLHNTLHLFALRYISKQPLFSLLEYTHSTISISLLSTIYLTYDNGENLTFTRGVKIPPPQTLENRGWGSERGGEEKKRGKKKVKGRKRKERGKEKKRKRKKQIKEI